MQTIASAPTTPAALPFELAEYQERITKTKRRMEEAGIEVLLINDPCNMYYLTGFDAWSFYVEQMLLLALDDDQPVWIGREMDASGARMTTFLDPENIIGYGDEYVQAADSHPMQVVADVLRERGWANRRLGLEQDGYFFSVRSYHELLNALPDATILDGSLLVNWVRLVKSETEIGYLEQAAEICNRAIITAIEGIKPGVRQCDVAAAIYQAQISGTPEFGGDYTSGPPLLPTGPRSECPHLGWTDEVYQPGEKTTVEIKTARLRYHVIQGRTVFLGTPPAALVEKAAVVIEGLNTTLAAIKPGLSCEEVVQVFSQSVAKHGIEKKSRMGYPIGIAYPPTIGERTASFRTGDRTILEPNMVFHLLPAIWDAEGGLVISEPIRITETGVQTLCDTPRELTIKPA
jgi:Xaa-Pro dipeptidase